MAEGIPERRNYPGKYLTLAKLNAITYRRQTPKVKVVNVNGYSMDAQMLKADLDKIYLPVGVDWQVENDDFSGSVANTFFDEKSGLLSDYNE
ncbi:hypothetical protein FACS189413_02180 [Bacteroidia bacterium]|nr:hypothetical protein FACS189413_02180 [Bacteroidia bacterium]